MKIFKWEYEYQDVDENQNQYTIEECKRNGFVDAKYIKSTNSSFNGNPFIEALPRPRNMKRSSPYFRPIAPVDHLKFKDLTTEEKKEEVLNLKNLLLPLSFQKEMEFVSYDVMTPAAARGILEAIYWHPGMRYIIKSIAVLNPIKFERIKSNGVKRKLPGKSMRKAAEGRAPVNNISPIYTSECPQQSTAMYLKDVHYVIEASIIMTDKANPSDNLTKFYKMLERRAQKGQCYHHPYLGTRECTADFRLWEKDTMPINPDMTNIDLGSARQSVTALWIVIIRRSSHDHQ